MSKKLTVLFAPIEAYGHVNPCIGIGQILQKRGHRIVFAIGESWSGRLTKFGFEEELIVIPKDTDKSEDELQSLLLKSGMISPLSPLEKIKNSGISKSLYPKAVASDPIMKDIISRVKPDVIIIDQMFTMPSLMSSCPWVISFPSNPLFPLNDERTPPPMSGILY